MKRFNVYGIIVALCLVLPVSAAIIRSGDVLDIMVQGQAGFSGRYVVSENGTIDYPLLADESIVNISTSELMSHLTFRLARHIDNPLVLITVVETPEITVTVLGLVNNPGPVRTYLGATLQEVLAAAGGPMVLADLAKIKIVPRDGSDRNARAFDMIAFMQEGSIDRMPRMKAGDTVILLSKERTNKVKVIGGVRSPGFFELTEKINVFEIIYLAGGPAEKADLKRVRRIYRLDDTSNEEIIDIQGYIDKGKMDEVPMVMPGDVIIVYTRWFDWRVLMAVLNNTLLFIVTLQAFSGIFN